MPYRVAGLSPGSRRAYGQVRDVVYTTGSLDGLADGDDLDGLLVAMVLRSG